MNSEKLTGMADVARTFGLLFHQVSQENLERHPVTERDIINDPGELARITAKASIDSSWSAAYEQRLVRHHAAIEMFGAPAQG